MKDSAYLEHQIECILFVSGEPVLFSDMAKTLSIDENELVSFLQGLSEKYEEEKRGIQLFLTNESAQFVSNKMYFDVLEKMIQPERNRNASQSVMETLAVIAYKQPVTRAEIESIRGVMCEYSLTQLQKMGFVKCVGQKETAGRPNLYATTDKFLRKFGLHSLDDLPVYPKEENTAEDIPVV